MWFITRHVTHKIYIKTEHFKCEYKRSIYKSKYRAKVFFRERRGTSPFSFCASLRNNSLHNFKTNNKFRCVWSQVHWYIRLVDIWYLTIEQNLQWRQKFQERASKINSPGANFPYSSVHTKKSMAQVVFSRLQRLQFQSNEQLTDRRDGRKLKDLINLTWERGNTK
jgi:hypothetical protein